MQVSFNLNTMTCGVDPCGDGRYQIRYFAALSRFTDAGAFNDPEYGSLTGFYQTGRQVEYTGSIPTTDIYIGEAGGGARQGAGQTRLVATSGACGACSWGEAAHTSAGQTRLVATSGACGACSWGEAAHTSVLQRPPSTHTLSWPVGNPTTPTDLSIVNSPRRIYNPSANVLMLQASGCPVAGGLP